LQAGDVLIKSEIISSQVCFTGLLNLRTHERVLLQNLFLPLSNLFVENAPESEFVPWA